ncbi:MAG: hypothetical protein D6677_09370 [Calditrichaeota bacterium]|nr:MAG: hypothetical protein D6677_09370 [Calditrichota bacterium]
MKFIVQPYSRVIENILPNSVQFLFIAHDVVIKTGLPYGFPGCISKYIYLFCGSRFKTGNE